MSQFAFLQGEWAPVFESAAQAEGAVNADPRTACFYARRALELALSSLAELLWRETAAMNLDNFVVRPKRRIVEKTPRPTLGLSCRRKRSRSFRTRSRGLPSELDPENGLLPSAVTRANATWR